MPDEPDLRPWPDASGGGSLDDVFEDLEQQAAGLHLAERDAELADRAHGEYARVTLESRVHASCGRSVRVELLGGAGVEGVLEQAGDGWFRVTAVTGQEWVVRLDAVTVAAGLSSRSTAEEVRPATARLGLRSALRRLSEEGDPVVVVRLDGRSDLVRVRRVGADFLEGHRVAAEAGLQGDPVLMPFAAVAAFRTR